jgi:hypothetical protein
MGLAPGEQLTFEFAQSQRRVLEKSTLESTEQINSDESTTSDTEALNATRATSRTEGWHVDTTGTLTAGYASLSVSAGYNQSVTDTNTATINHVTQATQKSAHSLRSVSFRKSCARACR